MDTILRIQFAQLTDKGKVRGNNEDSVIVDQNLGLVAVADGMGGHNAGELASAMAVKTLHETVAATAAGRLEVKNPDPRLSPPANMLHFAVISANRQIYDAAIRQTDRKGMGTTLSAALISRNSAAIAHVGDSRIYLCRAGKLVQLTNDHSLVMEQVRKGIMTKEEAETSTMQNILTRAVGIHKSTKIDVGEITLAAGDAMLLCSDGLFKVVSDPDMLTVLAAASLDPAAMCRALVNKALENGGPDNVTVAVAKLRNPTLLERVQDFVRLLFTKPETQKDEF